MKKKKTAAEPLVTSVASVVKSVQDTRPFTLEEVRSEKRKLHGILSDSLQVYADRLKNGEISMSSSVDLERLIRSMMLVMGEPDGVAQTDEQKTVITFEQPLSLEDADVKSVYERLTADYNNRNDKA